MLVYRHERTGEASAIRTEEEFAFCDRRTKHALEADGRQKPHVDIAILTLQWLGGVLP